MKMGFEVEVQWLREQIEKAAPSYIVFRTVAGETKALTVTKGGSDFESDQMEGYASETNTIDFLVNPDLLTKRPEAGDEIDELDAEGGNKIATYRVAAEPGVNPWEWSGQTRKMMRIHTKQVGDD